MNKALDKGYIAPALKKLRATRSLGQTVYIYGATGYGKTELVKQYLKNRRYRYVSCEDAAAWLSALPGETPDGGMEKQKEKKRNQGRSSWWMTCTC